MDNFCILQLFLLDQLFNYSYECEFRKNVIIVYLSSNQIPFFNVIKTKKVTPKFVKIKFQSKSFIENSKAVCYFRRLLLVNVLYTKKVSTCMSKTDRLPLFISY